MANEIVKYTAEQSELIRQTVAKGATNAELQMFLEFCKSTNLNPFKKEIWFIKSEKGGVQMMTGINGFLAIANNHPQFDGMEVSLEEKDGKLISATAKVYRKDRQHPSVATVYLQEYFKPSKYGNGMWEKMPRMMLQKVAKSVALREAFPQELGGMYTEDEMPAEYSVDTAKTPQITQESLKPAKVYRYAIQEFNDADKNQKALDWCEKHNIVGTWTDEHGLVIETDKPLSFFDEVKIND